jgi:predicted HTH domain antitoxin
VTNGSDQQADREKEENTMQQDLEKVMEALLWAHVFPDRLTLQQEAFRALLVLRPELRIEGAIALYRQGEISFARAAELCGLSQEELKQILAARGIFREVAPLEQSVFEQAAEALRRAGA